jgi:hypothetical protein
MELKRPKNPNQRRDGQWAAYERGVRDTLELNKKPVKAQPVVKTEEKKESANTEATE